MPLKFYIKQKGKIIFSGLGKSGHIAKKFHQLFHQLITINFYTSNRSQPWRSWNNKSDSTILISNSGETSELTNIISL